MTRSTDDIDEVIRAALGQADAELADRTREQSVTQLLAEAFRSRNRRLAIGGVIMNLVLLLTGIASGIRFFQATEERDMLLWGAALLLCFGAVSAIKIWYWLELNRLALARDIKRVELRVAQLAELLRNRESADGPETTR